MLRKTKDKLDSMYRGEPQMGLENQLHEINTDTKISRDQGEFLAMLHDHLRPSLSIEVGFAYGFSTLFMLDSMYEHGYGAHIAIDPYEREVWKDIGAAAVSELEFESRFTHVNARSVAALTEMYGAGTKAQFIYIDGAHTFDAVIVDFYCADKVLEIGGVMIFDDMWMPSISKAAAFIRANISSYEERPSPIPNLFCLQKVSEDERPWQHFMNF